MYDLATLRRLIADAGMIRVYDGTTFVDLRRALLAFVDEHERILGAHETERAEMESRLAAVDAELADERAALDDCLAENRALFAALTGEGEA